MLAVVLAGLKWLGIVLLIIAGLFLFVCLSVLLVPVRYKLQVTIDDKRRLHGTVSWLLHLVHISFQSGRMEVNTVSVFWDLPGAGQKREAPESRRQ